jgi:hypothetical protein
MLINGLGSNSLLDIVVFGRTAAHRVTETLRPSEGSRNELGCQRRVCGGAAPLGAAHLGVAAPFPCVLYSPAMPAAFFLNSWPILMYFMVVSNFLCSSWRWMACPGASFADAEVARPDRSEWPANRAGACLLRPYLDAQTL